MSEFERLRRSLLKKNQLFEDSDFPPTSSSIYYHQSPPYNFVWKRPHEICSNPSFLGRHGTGLSKSQSAQLALGKLGDPWLLSSMAALAVTRGLFYRVVPADQSFDPDEYTGLFRFRIWWFGEWKEVLVDDRLPTVSGQLVFNQSASGDTFWASLLEKAFAKLHGSYEALKYGSSMEGLADLTGGVAESIAIKEDPSIARQIVHKLLNMTCVLTAIVSNDNQLNNHHHSSRTSQGSGGSGYGPRAFERLPNGVIMSVNYRIVALERVESVLDGDLFYLIKLINPVGHGDEFIGAFENQSRDWPTITDHDRLRLESLDDDYHGDQGGSFWMTWHEFVKTFTTVEVIYLDGETARDEPSLRGRLPLQLKIYRSQWRRGVSAGGCRNHVESFHCNPQIQLQLATDLGSDDLTVISLSQHSVLEPKVIGFSVYGHSNDGHRSPSSEQGSVRQSTISAEPGTGLRLDRGWFKRTKSLINSPYTNSTQVSLRTQLEKGLYVVVPTTFEAGLEGLFDVRIYSTKSVKLSPLDTPSMALKPAILKAPSSFETKFTQYEQMFLQLADEHKSVNCFELQELLEASLPNDYVKSCATLEVARLIITAIDTTASGRLQYKDYKNIMCSLRFWQNTFKNHTKGTSGILRVEKLRDALIDVGFQLNCDNLNLIVMRYMRRDATLRFGDFVMAVLHLTIAFTGFSKKDLLETGIVKCNINDWLKSALAV